MTIAPPRRTPEKQARATGLAGPGHAPRLKSWIIGGCALALVLGGYWYFNGRTADVSRPSNAAAVRVAIVQKRDMAVIERSLGTVVANTLVQLTARVQGTLDNANFKEGQFVRKGDLLFQIDPRPFQVALAQAQANYRRDLAQQANADRDKQRYETLSTQGAISTQQRDTSETNADMLAATVAADKAAIDMAQLNLGYTQIRSPVDGKTGPIQIQPGNMIGASGNTGTALVTIAQVKPIKVSFTLPQTELPRIQARQQGGQILATLDTKDRRGRPLAAAVDFTSNAVSNQSGTIELRASFANDDLTLVPGQLVNVTVELNDIPDALVVPRDAVNDSPSGPFVFLVRNEKAVLVPVTVLFDDGTDAAISGAVAAGDTAVSEGQLRVVPGGKVRVLGAKANADAPETAKKPRAKGAQ
jgi:membrane fusion protein, multidrug efflux system